MLLSKAFRRPCRKNYISGYIWHKSFIQTVKCSFFNQIIVYQSFYGVPLTFSYFLLQGKVLFFTLRSFGKSLARCCLQSVPKTLPKKFYLRLYLTQTFIQTVKCSFLNQTIGYQSFYSALLTFSYFFYFKEKLCVSARVGEMFPLKTLSKKLYLRFYLTRIVHSNGKILFPWRKNCLSKILEY